MSTPISNFFHSEIQPSLEELEKSLGIRKRIVIFDDSQVVELENSQYFDTYKNDGKKHYVYIPF